MELLKYITESEKLEPKKLKEISKNTTLIYKSDVIKIELENTYSDRVDLKEQYGLLIFNSTINLNDLKHYITNKVYNRTYFYDSETSDIESEVNQEKLKFVDFKLDIIELFNNEFYMFEFNKDSIIIDYKLFDLVLEIKQSEFGIVVNNITKTKHDIDMFNVVNNDFYIELGTILGVINKNKETFNDYFNFCFNYNEIGVIDFKIQKLDDVFVDWISEYLTLGKQENFTIISYIRNVDIQISRKLYSTVINVTDEDGNVLYTETTKTTNIVKENLVNLIEKIYNFI